MPRSSCHRPAVLLSAALLSLLVLPAGSSAQVARHGSGPLDRLTLADPRLQPSAEAVPFEEVQALLPAEVRDGWNRFLVETAGEWQGYADRRTGRLEAAEGSGIPWVPGHGNDLALRDLEAPLKDGAVDLRTLEAIARAFLPRTAPLLGTEPESLVLSPGRSGHPDDSLWLVDFDVQREGRTIEGARVVFRVNNGNLVQFGTEGLPAAGAQAPRQSVDRRAALAALGAYVGGFGAADTFVDGGSLHLLSATVSDPGFAEGFQPGNGRGLALVWQLVFRRRGETGTWRARVDAETGRVVDFRDVNEYAKVTGGVYPVSFADSPETVLPMPFADVAPGSYTSSAGVYSFAGGSVASTLNGLYLQIFDTCGPISKSGSGTGRIAFGTSSGTDCATPGTGGAGNTHAARIQFYHLNRVKEIGRSWLPANSWLNGKLTANVNLNQTCNAYWDGYTVNFFRSGGGCGNTGEIAGVSLHEYGHGLDQNDGNSSSPDLGTAESYADVTGALVTHRSCQGNGFFSGNCGGYGDACTACSGVRDIDWAQHTSNTPHTVANFTQLRCGGGGGYNGACGGEGHCESYVISEAVWDLAARDLPNPGGAGAWSVTERLWYLSRSTTGSAFSCHTGSSTWTSDGCTAGSLWRTFRAMDDDDGNLANGTPHSCQIFAAFDRHGLACASDPGANVCFAACTPPPVPALTLTPAVGQIALSWTGGGAGQAFDVYKSELGCGSGLIRVAGDVTGTAFTDTAVADGLTYSYQVVAHAAGNPACAAAPSVCQSAQPVSQPCTPPPVPSGVAAVAFSFDRIRVTWNASAGATDYFVLRSATPGGPYIQVATLPAPATSWMDTGRAEGTQSFYVVRAAIDDCVSADSTEVSAVTPVCTNPTVLYSNDFESGSGLADWTVVSVSGGLTQDWRGIQTCDAHSGSKVFRFGAATCTSDYLDNGRAAARPQGATGIAVPATAARIRLSFWHRWDFEYGYDGGRLTLGVDGASPVDVPASAIIGGSGYNGSFQFTGYQATFVNTVVDLDTVCDLATGGDTGCGGHTLAIGFLANTDYVGTGQGWFLDDVTVTGCTLHGCTGAPAIGTATAPAANQAQVTWSNGAPASSAFNVYRALGTCASPGAFEKVGSAVPGSPFLDTDVSGGSAYAYRISGLDASGLCESDLSGCAEVAATGACTLPPAFAGLAAVGNPGQTTCALDLSWPGATARCGGPVTYNVYRSTVPGFTPGPGSLTAAGVTATAWHDPNPLVDRFPYVYIVRAVDGANGREDSNTVRQSAAPTGPFLTMTFADTFEGTASGGGFDNGGWTHAALSGGVDWVWSGAQSQSPSHSWYAPSQSTTADRVLVSPAFVPQAGSTLTFWHTYEFDECFDGGTLEISTDGGATWTVVPDAAFLEGGFNGTLAYSPNPIGNKRAWCRGQLGAMTRVRLDLSSWAGTEARLRWHAGEDPLIAFPGWYVDSVSLENVGTVSTCTPAPPSSLDFYTLPPCRLADTRTPTGGPALQPGTVRTFQAAGICGVPATAKAVAVNLTVTQPATGGYLTLAPAGPPAPLASSINFQTGQTLANNAVLPLGDGTGVIQVRTVAGGTVQLVLDVSGYFQ
jgi:hypothetical protein